MPANAAAVQNYYMFTRWPENRGDVNDVIYDADGACMGRYGCVGGPTRDNMGSREWLVVGLKSRAASARVTKHFVTIFSKTCNKYEFRILNSRFLGWLTRVIFYVRRIGLYLYKYRIYGTISIFILKGLALHIVIYTYAEFVKLGRPGLYRAQSK